MKKIIASVIVLVVIANVLLLKESSNLFVNGKDFYQLYFCIHNTGLFILFFICFILLLNYSVLLEYYDKKDSKYHYYEIERVGYKVYYKKTIKDVVIKSISFKLLFEVLFIISLFCIGAKLDWSYDPAMIQKNVSFHSNLMINISIYLVLSTIGTCVISLFGYSLIHFFKNRYIYLISPVVLYLLSLIVCIAVVSLVSPILYTFTQNEALVQNVLSFMVISNLSEIGLFERIGYGNICFVLTAIFFTTITFILFKIEDKRMKRNG